jgi:multiple sugar transport system permease protein
MIASPDNANCGPLVSLPAAGDSPLPLGEAGAQRRVRARWRQRATPYVFIAPNLILFTLFLFAPIGAAIAISFQNRGILGAGTWVGVQNYLDISQDSLFWQSLSHTLLYTLGTVPTSMALGLGLAVMLNRWLPLRALLRSVYFVPVVIAGVVVALVWAWMFDTSQGVINGLLLKVGLARVPWTTSQGWALPSLMITTIWVRMGFCMVVYLAGLQSIPASLEEAATVDGAGAWRRFWSVTWPLLAPTTFLLLIISVVFSFQVFDLIYVMTGGGPGFSTTVLVGYIYRAAFMQFKMGYASALGVVLFILVLGFTAVQWRLSRQGDTSATY